MNSQPFGKFFNKKSNAAVKEEYRQEKRKAKKERREAGRQQTGRPAWKKNDKFSDRGGSKSRPAGTAGKSATHKEAFPMPLNKYLAHCGIASRREAVEIIKNGDVRVNDQQITEPFFRVSAKDKVVLKGKKISVVKTMVYILLNKPKDFITTTADPKERKTVMNLIRQATTERVYPVGRLDRNTTGVLLITNDGDLTQKMTHPSFEVQKVYEVKLDNPLHKAHFDEILKGIQLDDGEIHADTLAYTDPHDKRVIGIEIHSGRNRIVRRLFEHLGYRVVHLDRVMYAGLTKKDVLRGKWRLLNDKEILRLQQLKGHKRSPEK